MTFKKVRRPLHLVCRCTSACVWLHWVITSHLLLIASYAEFTCSSGLQLPFIPATFQRHVPTAVQSELAKKNDDMLKTPVKTTGNTESFNNSRNATYENSFCIGRIEAVFTLTLTRVRWRRSRALGTRVRRTARPARSAEVCLQTQQACTILCHFKLIRHCANFKFKQLK